MKLHLRLVIFTVLGLCLSGCIEKATQKETDLSPKLLNSERIRHKYGSYGIEVLKQDSAMRVSNLYSGQYEQKITRTLAVVLFSQVVDQIYLEEHTRIINGESLGKVFKRSGWKISKKTIYKGEIVATSSHQQFLKLMDITSTNCAIYVYQFHIEKDDTNYKYATIAEVYHPEYLTLEDVNKIYGTEYNSSAEEKVIQKILEKVDTELRYLSSLASLEPVNLLN